MKSLLQFLIYCALIISIGCTKNNDVQIKIGEEFTLPFQQEVALKKTDLRFEFVEVIEDSRCPKGSYCNWAGQIVIQLSVLEGEKISTIELSELGDNTNIGETTATYGQYQIELIEVTPYPENDPIKAEDYEVILKLTE